MTKAGVNVSLANAIKIECRQNGGALTILQLCTKYGLSSETIMNVIHKRRKYGKPPYVPLEVISEIDADSSDAAISDKFMRVMLDKYFYSDGSHVCRGISTVLLTDILHECFQKDILPEVAEYSRLKEFSRLEFKRMCLSWGDIGMGNVCDYKQNLKKGRGLCVYSNRMTSILTTIRFTDEFIELYKNKGAISLNVTNV
jgi:hypothetical protein